MISVESFTIKYNKFAPETRIIWPVEELTEQSEIRVGDSHFLQFKKFSKNKRTPSELTWIKVDELAMLPAHKVVWFNSKSVKFNSQDW